MRSDGVVVCPARSRRSLFLGLLGLLGLGVVVGALGIVQAACSSPEKLAGEGGTCFEVTDCAPGLVCAPQADGSRRCTSDFSGIVHTEEAGTVDEGGGPQGDASSGDANPADGQPPKDVTQDVNPPDDVNPPQDTGAQDTGAGDAPVD
jgi:hypothetical protein